MVGPTYPMWPKDAVAVKWYVFVKSMRQPLMWFKPLVACIAPFLSWGWSQAEVALLPYEKMGLFLDFEVLDASERDVLSGRHLLSSLSFDVIIVPVTVR